MRGRRGEGEGGRSGNAVLEKEYNILFLIYFLLKIIKGTRVRVYTTNSQYLPNIISGLKGSIPLICD